MNRPRFILRPLLAAVACAVGMTSVAACSSSSSPGSSATPSASASASATATTAAAAAPLTTPTQKAIAANWAEFFNPKAPTAKRVALLEDASSLSSALSGMATNLEARTSTAKVVSVAVESSTRAKVVYDVLVSGTPMLTNQTGLAVYQDGTWKVSVASFCALLALQSGGSTSKLPAACKSAS